MDEDLEDLKDILKPILIVICMILIFPITPIIIASYYSSCREAKIFNEKYQANYSCDDFFWAKDQINSQVQIIKLEK